jgi:hypothetical protein
VCVTEEDKLELAVINPAYVMGPVLHGSQCTSMEVSFYSLLAFARTQYCQICFKQSPDFDKESVSVHRLCYIP